MTKIMMSLAATTAIALMTACGSEAPPAAKAAKAKALTPGEYEVTREVTKLASADQSTPATTATMGEKTVTRACIAADGKLDPAMFVEAGDSCTQQSSYLRSGRLSVQYQCTRPNRGNVYPAADGNFTADGFEAVVTVATAFDGDGDYNLTRMLTARRVGDCPAGGASATSPPVAG
ncbi:MAG: DUF3617 domain-containing protein [Pseudomonadota bacterium]|nr:DUF3617 domain-containing protein [Pseudomonadota bacterium]